MQVYAPAEVSATAELDLRCPPLPQTLLEAIDLSNQPAPVEIEQVLKLVEKDPVVITRLLRIVNSAYYAQRGTITNIYRAVLILGPSPVVGLVMGMSMMELRASLDATTMVPFMNLVRHTVATAFLAQRIVQKDPGYNPHQSAWTELAGSAFTAGMLHDLGKLVLLYNYPGKAVRAYVTASSTQAARLEAERAALGIDHVAAGTFLMRKLNLPVALSDAVALHHDVEAAEGRPAEFRRLLYTLVCADRAASAMGYAFDRPLSWEQFAADPLWDRMVEQGLAGYTVAAELVQSVAESKKEVERHMESVF